MKGEIEATLVNQKLRDWVASFLLWAKTILAAAVDLITWP